MIKDWVIELYERINWTDLFVSISILAFFLLFRKLLTKFIFTYLARVFRNFETTLMWLQAFEKPFRILLVALGVYLTVIYVMPLHWQVMFSVDRIFRSVGILLAGWGIFNISASSSVFLERAGKRFSLDASSMLIPFLSKVLRFVIVIVIVTLVVSEWGFSINGVVAGMGLGSLAVALAAKDTLGNIFGGVVIILEKPFAKGEWILTPSVEGVVEDITFRSTQIRTFADSVVTVPNAALADQPITNWSKMGKRRITFTLGIALDCSRERLAAAVARMENMLIANENIDPETILVKFSDFNESSLGIFFYFFTKTTVWSEYLTIRQDINYGIMTILEEEGIQLAYPSQRIFLEDTVFKPAQVRSS